MPANDEVLKKSVVAKLLEQQAFIERGLSSREYAQKSGEYFSSEKVLRALDEIIANAKRTQNSKST